VPLFVIHFKLVLRCAFGRPWGILKGKLVEAVANNTLANTANYQNLLSCSNGNLDTSSGSTWCCGGAGSSTCCNSAFQLVQPSDPTDGLTGKAFIPDIREPMLTITTTITSTLLPSNGVIATTITMAVAGTATASLGSNAGLSNGAVAGVSVAAAVGGAVIGLAIAFLLLRKQSRWFGLLWCYYCAEDVFLGQPPPHIADQQTVDFPSKPPNEIDSRQARYEVQ
jgi:hypothetical protein